MYSHTEGKKFPFENVGKSGPVSRFQTRSIVLKVKRRVGSTPQWQRICLVSVPNPTGGEVVFILKKKKIILRSGVWRHTVSSSTGEVEAGQEFKAILSYVGSLQRTRATCDSLRNNNGFEGNDVNQSHSVEGQLSSFIYIS